MNDASLMNIGKSECSLEKDTLDLFLPKSELLLLVQL
jgi:hypothetical protein